MTLDLQLDEELPARPKSAWVRRLLALHDRLGLVLTSASPTTGLAWADMVGRVAYRLSLSGPSASEVGRFFGSLPKPRLEQIALEITASAFKNRAVQTMAMHAGLERLAPLIRCRDVEPLLSLHRGNRPAILAVGHVGARFGVLVGLHRLGIPALFLSRRPLISRLPRGLEVCTTQGGVERQTFALKRALDHLRGGGFVLIAIDAQGGTSGSEVTFMGRPLVLRRGVATLARLTGAPVIPIVASWTPRAGLIDLSVHNPLPRPACPPEAGSRFDTALLSGAARWLEGCLRSNPEQLREFFLELCARAWDTDRRPGVDRARGSAPAPSPDGLDSG